MRNFLRSCLSFTIILSLFYSPLAIQSALATEAREEFDRVCKQSLKDVEAKKSTEGDQTMAYCVQADMARQAKNLETVKSVIFLTAAAVDIAMVVTIKVEQGIRTVGYGYLATGTALLACIYTAGAGAAFIMLGNGTIAAANAAIEACQNVCKITDIAAAAAGIATGIFYGCI